jgi:hypothetical protein
MRVVVIAVVVQHSLLDVWREDSNMMEAEIVVV